MISYSSFEALGYGTSIYDGLSTSVSEFDNQSASRHVILLSDGNQVINNRPSPAVAAQEASQAGVIVHTIAFGGNLGVLQQISDATGGSDFTALSEEDLKDAFAALLGKFTVDLVD